MSKAFDSVKRKMLFEDLKSTLKEDEGVVKLQADISKPMCGYHKGIAHLKSSPYSRKTKPDFKPTSKP